MFAILSLLFLFLQAPIIPLNLATRWITDKFVQCFVKGWMRKKRQFSTINFANSLNHNLEIYVCNFVSFVLFPSSTYFLIKFANSLDHKCLQYFVKGWMRKKWQFSICLANSLNHVFEIHLYLDTVPNLGNLLCKGRQQKRTAAGGFLDQNDHFKMKNRKNLGSPHLVLYRFSRCFSYRFLFQFYAVC